LDLHFKPPPTGSGIEEEDGRNMDNLPSDPAKETTQRGGDDKEAITQIKT
jgi:hypothetical protein